MEQRRHWHTPCWSARSRRTRRAARVARVPDIRANTVLPGRPAAGHPADRRRPRRWSASSPFRWAATPVATLVCLHPLPSGGGMMDSHVLQEDGQATARAGRPRRAALQHPGHDQRRRAPARASSARRSPSSTTSRPPSTSWSPWTCLAIWLRRLELRHRPRADARPATRAWSGRSCSALRCASPVPSTCWPGRRPASRCSRSCRSTTTTCGRPRRRSASPVVPQAEVVGRRRRQAPVGRPGRGGARPDRADHQPGGLPPADPTRRPHDASTSPDAPPSSPAPPAGSAVRSPSASPRPAPTSPCRARDAGAAAAGRGRGRGPGTQGLRAARRRHRPRRLPRPGRRRDRRRSATWTCW